MKTMKRWVLVGWLMAAASAGAQTYLAMTNTLFYTNRWTSVVGRVQSAPLTTNDPWVVSFTLVGPTAPGWALTTNNATVNYNAGSYATVSITNSEIATFNGQTVSQVVNMGYFAASTNATQAALQKLIFYTIGK